MSLSKAIESSCKYNLIRLFTDIVKLSTMPLEMKIERYLINPWNVFCFHFIYINYQCYNSYN